MDLLRGRPLTPYPTVGYMFVLNAIRLGTEGPRALGADPHHAADLARPRRLGRCPQLAQLIPSAGERQLQAHDLVLQLLFRRVLEVDRIHGVAA